MSQNYLKHGTNFLVSLQICMYGRLSCCYMFSMDIYWTWSMFFTKNLQVLQDKDKDFKHYEHFGTSLDLDRLPQNNDFLKTFTTLPCDKLSQVIYSLSANIYGQQENCLTNVSWKKNSGKFNYL